MIFTETEQKEIAYLLQFFFRNKKILLLSLVIGAAMGAVVSFALPPKYTAKAVIFAINYSDLEKNQANMPFGLDIHADQLIQVMISNRLKDSVIQHLSLDKYYNIDRNKQNWQEILDKKWQSEVKVQKTRFLSIDITVKTRDPKFAANIANEMVSYADKIYNEMLDENEKIYMLNLKKNYDAQQIQLKTLMDSLSQLQISNKDTFKMNLLKRHIRGIEQYVNGDLEKQYLYSKSRFERKMQVLNIVENAKLAGEPSFPVWHLNIVIGATLGLFFTIIIKFLRFYLQKFHILD